VESKERRDGYMVKDEDDAFEQELLAAPWGYGQPMDIWFIIAQLQRRGLHREAKWLADEWEILTKK
jgi:hypothetical protein